MGLNLIETLHRQVGKAISGQSIWDFDADIYCILDGCRVDTFRETIDANADSYWSVASSSPEWIRRTFDRELDTLGYITANPFSDRETRDCFAYFHHEPITDVDGIETVKPKTLANHAARLWNEREQYGVETLVVHFMQPHVPFKSRPEWFKNYYGTEVWGSEQWDCLNNGEIPKREWLNAYRENLRWVYENGVRELAETTNATLGVTADHGNGTGEFGIYGHPKSVAVPSVRKVPWQTLEATKERESPTVALEANRLDTNERTQQLEALGYK